MRIYNTLTKQVEEFIPYEENKVKMYTCGPTVYHYAHIGNLRTYIFEDILLRTLRRLTKYKNVTRVMNITDVGHLTSDADTGEDKMLLGAEREHKTVHQIANFYTRAFKNDCRKLNIQIPKIFKKASNQIEDYIKIIGVLIDKGYAYEANGNIYFDVSKAKDYYRLTGNQENKTLVGVRDDVNEDVLKRNQADFALWFTKSKFENQEMTWVSPWGRGYPGWHIECSTIAYKYLGEYLDIHCGGVDNIFPHHTNEIAQSEAYFGHEWCKYWMHGEHLNDESGKMSKSKGEFLTLSLLIEKGYNPLAYRYFCLGSHYRKQLVFSYESLDTAASAYTSLLKKIKEIKKNINENESSNFKTNMINANLVKEYRKRFRDALNDDLNTSNALTTLHDTIKDNNISNATKIKLIYYFDRVLALDLLIDEKKISVDEQLNSYINKMIEKRNEAKKDKNYTLADQIREELLSKGIIIKDTREGTVFDIIK